jgi:hypothetical protein
MSRFFILLIAITGIFSSCRTTKKIQTAISRIDTVVVAPPVNENKAGEDSLASLRQIIHRLDQKRINYTTFSSKIEVDYKDADGKKYNVNAHLRMYKDSVIWISITAILGIEGLRAYVTRDSVKVLDKQNKVYTARSVAYLQDVIALPLDLYSLQDMLVGNPVFLDSNIVSFERSANSTSLVMTHSFFKHLLTISEPDGNVESSKLDDLDELRNRTCYLTYENYEDKKGVLFPAKRSINVTEKKKLDIKLNFKQYDFNETLSFPFSVPKNYKSN